MYIVHIRDTCILTSSIRSPIFSRPSLKAGPPLLILLTYMGISSLVATSRDANPNPNVPFSLLLISILFLTPNCLVLVIEVDTRLGVVALVDSEGTVSLSVLEEEVVVGLLAEERSDDPGVELGLLLVV